MKPDAHVLNDVRGVIEFEDVSFHYIREGKGLLKDIRRFGLLQDSRPVSPGDSTEAKNNSKSDQDEEKDHPESVP